jgi:hypothetical protein
MDGRDPDENPEPGSWYRGDDSETEDILFRMAMRVDGEGNDPEEAESEDADGSDEGDHHVRFAGG